MSFFVLNHSVYFIHGVSEPTLHFILPYPHNLPIMPSQKCGYVSVSLSITRDLLPPEIIFQQMLPARILPSMPEITIEENAYFLLFKNYIGVAVDVFPMSGEFLLQTRLQGRDKFILKIRAAGTYPRHQRRPRAPSQFIRYAFFLESSSGIVLNFSFH